MTTPRVSVIVPIYQQEAFVAEMIESLLSQTLADIEIIVIDDGSTDRSGIIAQSFGDSRINYIRRANGGPSVASNDGMLRARGEFIALMGGDDVAEPWRLAHQVEIADQCGADILFSEPALIDAEGRFLRDAVVPNFYGHPVHRDAALIFRQLVLQGNFLCAPTALMRRSVFEQVGLFRPELIQLQDYDYWLRAAAIGKKISVMPRRTTRYRRHIGNLSSAAADDAMMGELMFCICRALASAPGEMIAAAFPEAMPPGKSCASGLDRAVVAMTHPYASALAKSLTLHAFLADEPQATVSDVSMADQGRLAMATSTLSRTILQGAAGAPMDQDMEAALWGPIRRRQVSQ